MNRPRPGRGQADADFAGELRVRTGHERGHLFMTYLHEVDVVGAVEGAHDSVDAVARVSIDAPYAPLMQPGDEEVTRSLCHAVDPQSHGVPFDGNDAQSRRYAAGAQRLPQSRQGPAPRRPR